MTPLDDGPLTRALGASEQVQGSGMDPVTEAALQSAREGLLEAQEERRAPIGVIREAARLLTTLDSCTAALEQWRPGPDCPACKGGVGGRGGTLRGAEPRPLQR